MSISKRRRPRQAGMGVVCLAGGAKVSKLTLYWTGQEWQGYPIFPWF
jgi:hypothetical protein